MHRVYLALAALALLPPLMAWPQYPGQVTKKSKDAADLRAIAVLEWTGEAGKPKACRMVPVTVFDGEKLQDGGLYMARPEPLALSGEVEYQLKENGKTIGLFDIKNAGQEEGSWVGYGDWKPVAKPKPAFAATAPPIDDEDDDKPVLHRKKKSDSGESSGSGSSTTAPDSDPDRPKLHKKDDSASSTGGNSAPDSGSPSDPDRPKLHKKTSDDSAGNSGGTAPVDPDRPALKKPKAQQPTEDVGHVDSLPGVTDPDRPRLQRGKSSGNGLQVLPTLMGLPPDMQQAVAVSDAKDRPDHPWSYSWASPGDEAKMKAALEDIAREALGLVPPPPPPAPAPARTLAARRAAAAKKAAAPPPAPAELRDEEFRVFELAYGSGATMVLTANTGGPPANQKFITLIAQPDLYGNVSVLLKSVTDAVHLDETPRMRLVDAVDALADNRGELLFELRSGTMRQFALYRVMRGSAEKVFVSGGGAFGTMSSE